MKYLKYSTFILLLIFGLNVVYAQNKSRVEHRVAKLKEALQLTDEQATKITEIMQQHEQVQTEEQSKKLQNKKSMLKYQRNRMSEMDKEIEPLLTPEQLKKYESYKKERLNQMKSGNKGKKFKGE